MMKDRTCVSLRGRLRGFLLPRFDGLAATREGIARMLLPGGGERDLAQRRATHPRLPERDTLVIGHRDGVFAFCHWVAFEPRSATASNASARLRIRAIAASKRWRNSIANLPVLLKSRNTIGPDEVVGETLKPCALANRYNAIIVVVDWPQRREVPAAGAEGVRQPIGMQSVVERPTLPATLCEENATVQSCRRYASLVRGCGCPVTPYSPASGKSPIAFLVVT